jgi:hypothetical protein
MSDLGVQFPRGFIFVISVTFFWVETWHDHGQSRPRSRKTV